MGIDAPYPVMLAHDMLTEESQFKVVLLPDWLHYQSKPCLPYFIHE